ncbi:MAG: argininosuccinate lyase [Methanophagales archaeon ANME-1-THS]|nr:MAG: argininosuccinate lyase [Methanophagales archaeon ANME-1-THS]
MVKDYILSLEADRWLVHADILVDRAHVVMLQERGILKKKEAAAILGCLAYLEEQEQDFIEHELPLHEDLHTAIESVVIRELGEEIGGRMHTARSRNDEVATCIRIALRNELLAMMRELNGLRKALLEKAAGHIDTIMPGYTHLQHAQATTYAHYLLAHADAFARDFSRLLQAYACTNLSPLGAAAFASTGFPIDRERTAKLLGFDIVLEHSIDAVSTRDFVIEAISCFANLMVNLSRLAEELILWCTAEFDFIHIPAEYATGSSIMPQKRNPDYAELVRAKSGTVYGCLMSVLSICKALPYSYNRDLQEVTPHLVRATKSTTASIAVMAAMVEGLDVKKAEMEKKAPVGFTAATELADTIVRKTGMSFRTAHKIISSAVPVLVDENMKLLTEHDAEHAAVAEILRQLDEIALSIIGKKLSEMGLTEKEVKEALNITSNIQKRKGRGGPAKKEVQRMIERRRGELEKDEKSRQEKEERVRRSMEELDREVKKKQKRRSIRVIKKPAPNRAGNEE